MLAAWLRSQPHLLPELEPLKSTILLHIPAFGAETPQFEPHPYLATRRVTLKLVLAGDNSLSLVPHIALQTGHSDASPTALSVGIQTARATTLDQLSTRHDGISPQIFLLS